MYRGRLQRTSKASSGKNLMAAVYTCSLVHDLFNVDCLYEKATIDRASRCINLVKPTTEHYEDTIYLLLAKGSRQSFLPVAIE